MRNILVLSAIFLLSIGTNLYAQLTPDPSPDQFIDASEEPRETVPIEKLTVYPDSARRNGIEGKVTLQALIGKDGSVEKVEVVKADNAIFKDAAIDAMRREKFSPAKQNGTPIKLWITRTINFKLNPGGPASDTSKGSYNLKQSDSRPRFNFHNMIGLSLDSARDLFKIWGDVRLDTEKDGIHLHAKSPDGFAKGKVAITADGIMGHSGLRQATVVFRSASDDDFLSGAQSLGAKSLFGGKLVSQTTLVELPNALATVTADAKERTIRIDLKSK